MHRIHHVADQRIDRVDDIRPGAGRASERHAVVELPFLAHQLGDARDLGGFRFLEIDDVVEGLRDLAIDAGEVERHAYGEVAALEQAQRFQQLSAVEHHLQACVHGFHGFPPGGRSNELSP